MGCGTGGGLGRGESEREVDRATGGGPCIEHNYGEKTMREMSITMGREMRWPVIWLALILCVAEKNFAQFQMSITNSKNIIKT